MIYIVVFVLCFGINFVAGEVFLHSVKRFVHKTNYLERHPEQEELVRTLRQRAHIPLISFVAALLETTFFHIGFSFGV